MQCIKRSYNSVLKVLAFGSRLNLLHSNIKSNQQMNVVYKYNTIKKNLTQNYTHYTVVPYCSLQKYYF